MVGIGRRTWAAGRRSLRSARAGQVPAGRWTPCSREGSEMRATWLLPLCLLLPACASAKAGLTSEDVYAREGAYISAAGIYGIEAFPTPSPYHDADNSKGGAGLRIGYRGDNDTAIEFFAEDVRGFNLDSDTDPGVKVELRNLGVAGKLYLTGGRFQPYVLLGAGWSMAIYSEHA